MKPLMRHVAVLILVALAAAPSWARDLTEIHSSGRLTVAARPSSTLIYSPDTRDLPGFCYELASAFARAIDLDVDMVPVSSFRDYWEPVESDGTPALLTEVDLYADILTVTPQRREAVAMVPFIDNTEILVGASTTTAESFEDLRGRRIAVVEGMSFGRVLESALTAAGVPYQREPAGIRRGVIVPTSTTETADTDAVRILLLPPGTRTTLMFFPDQLAKGAIDFFILDSFSLFHQLTMSQSLRTSVRPAFPLNREVGRLAFATSRHAPELEAALGNWMRQYR
ncbi:MAG: transporter substrate-binding domain-containing protein, partial [Spirochaetes bacterium]|nr:transporter substrate-binding domain-containing protein [Spirochaetota bacterium]